MISLKRISSTHLLAALIALALAVSAFAHRAMPVGGQAGAYPADFDVFAYRLPDGSLPSFCLSFDEENHEQALACDFCTLANGTALPGALPSLVALQPSGTATKLPATSQVSEPSSENLKSVRAPPALS